MVLLSFAFLLSALWLPGTALCQGWTMGDVQRLGGVKVSNQAGERATAGPSWTDVTVVVFIIRPSKLKPKSANSKIGPSHLTNQFFVCFEGSKDFVERTAYDRRISCQCMDPSGGFTECTLPDVTLPRHFDARERRHGETM